MSDGVKIHNNQFNPPGSGRPPLADISSLIYAAAENPNMWVSQVMTNKEANSALGQLRRRGYQASTAQVDADHREVYAMYNTEAGD